MVIKYLTRKILIKYSIFIIISYLITHFLYSLVFKIYYNFSSNPDLISNEINVIQNILSSISFLFGIVVALFMFFDLKGKKILEWLIIVISIFYTEIGVVLFLILCVLKEYEIFEIKNQ